jgi:O-methyltransferase involved in polyketide biosynthesis
MSGFASVLDIPLTIVRSRAMPSIGPTALYTGHVWARNGLSHHALDPAEGRVLHAAANAALLPVRLLGGPALDGVLLARHRVIDAELEAAIADGRVGQVLELACGMSPRGWRFTERHPDLLYVEADLPDMAARKRAALERIGRPAGHRVVEADALAAAGPRSIAALAAAELDPARGLAIITEGLLNYLPRDAVEDLWGRLASTLDAFGDGLYLSDLFTAADAPPVIGRVFAAALSGLVRGRVGLHFADGDAAAAALRQAGFAHASVARASEHPAAGGLQGADLVRIVRAAGRA